MMIADIFKQHYQYIFSYAVKLTGQINDAEDLTSETFLVAMTKIEQLKDEKAVKHWLRKICLNQYLMYKRKNDRIQWSTFNEDVATIQLLNQAVKCSIEDEMIVEESIKHIRTVCMLTLTRRMGDVQRIIFTLVDILGLKVNEVSDMMEMSVPAIKSHLNRARIKLDEELSLKCGLLNVENPCQCKAWEQFVLMRETRKQMARNMDVINIKDLIADMSLFEPSDNWYDKMMNYFMKR